MSGGVLESSAIVSVTVSPVNDAPLAQDDTAETEVDRPMGIDVLDNDRDVDGDSLIISQVSSLVHGTSVLNGTHVIYTPGPGFIGSDSLNYTLSDGQLTASGAVNITVTPPRYLITMSWEDDLSVPVNGFRLYYNGAAICETADPTIRQMSCKIPVSDEVKTFTLTALDADGVESVLSNALTYDPTMWNHDPVAQDISLHMQEDIVLNAMLPAVDSDGDPLIYTLLSNGTSGKAVIIDSASGTFSYTPQANVSGSDSFTFMVNDGEKDSAPATVTLTITAVNDVPVAAADAATTLEDQQVSISVLNNDMDVDGDALVLQGIEQGTHGQVMISSLGGLSIPRPATITVRIILAIPLPMAMVVLLRVW